MQLDVKTQSGLVEAGTLLYMSRKNSVRKNSSIFIFRPIPDDVAMQIWERAGTYEHQDWTVPEDKELLASIVGNDVANDFYEITDSKVQNVALRKIMQAPLRSTDVKKKNAAIKWVVYDWGNIPPQEDEDEDRLYEMCSEFTDYADEEINEFAKKHKGDRIASWSKVIAFADSESFAIFDARVAMSLNYILDEMDFPRKFIMPQAISPPFNKVFSHIRGQVNAHFERKKLSYMGYMEYKALLLTLVRLKVAPSVLGAEMCLFANGEIYANRYAAKHGLEIPYPKVSY